MKIINLTPHSITFFNEDGTQILVVEPSGEVARVSVKTEQIGEFAGIPITQSVYSDIVDLPEPEKDTVYIVSSVVAQRTNRKDVFIPNESIRDDKGRIIGCRSLGKI